MGGETTLDDGAPKRDNSQRLQPSGSGSSLRDDAMSRTAPPLEAVRWPPAHASTFQRIPTKQKRRSTGQGAKKPLDPQRPEKNMGPGWRQRPRTFAPQASVMAAGVRDDVGHKYTCFM